MAPMIRTRLAGAFLALFGLCPWVAAQDVSPLAVPDATEAAPATLPPRPLPDLTLTLDLGAAFERATALYAHFRDMDPHLDARVLALDLDPEQAFVLIRDEVRSLPYDGHLRDTSSVFAAASGNAYDKSLALADLLGRMGYDTQLVTGPGVSPSPDGMFCGTGTVDPESWELTRFGPEVLDRVPLRAAASYAMLNGLLAPQDQPATVSGQPHVWVQMRDGADWVDLDPWLPDTAYGAHPAGAGTLLQEPPAPHSVSIAVFVETLADGQLSQDKLLEREFQMPLAAESLIALYFGASAEGAGSAILNALDALEGNGGQMAPFLMVNDEIVKGRSFAAPGPAIAAADGFFAENTDPATTTAVLFTVTSHVPGQPDHTETRWVIDLVPPELRLSDPETIDPAALLTPIPGEVFPAAMEGLRHFMVSNGGTPLRFLAAEQAKQIVGLRQVLARLEAGIPNPYDGIWSAYLEAARVQLAAELLIRARPVHDDTCAIINRPRVLIWGISGGPDQQVLRWLDWTIDDITMIGGDARARAEAQLWHGALQAALEKEALLLQILLPDDSIPLDAAPMQPVETARLATLGIEATIDAERGYLTLANAAMPENTWWRLNPANGLADARGRFRGNEWGNHVNATPNSGPRYLVPEDPSLANREGDAIWREIERQERQRAALRASEPKCGGNEYMILGTCVSIPGSIAAGVIGIVVLYGLYSYWNN